MFRRRHAAAPGRRDGYAGLPGVAPIVWVTLYVGLLLNLPTLWRRATRIYAAASGPWPVLGVAGELALVLAVTATILLVLAWFGRHVWRLAAATLIVVSALCAYYMTMFNVVIGYGVLSAVFTTDHDMSGEVVGLGVIAWVLVLGVLPAALVARSGRPADLPELLRQPRALKPQVVMLAAAIALFSFGRVTLKQAAPRLRGADTELVANLAGIAAHSYVPTNWISGSAMVASNAWAAGRSEQALRAPAKLHRYSESVPLDGVHLVVVIGESARHDHVGLLGHARDTSPEMAREPHLAAFRAEACDTSTKLAISCMFVRPEGIEVAQGVDPDRVVEDNVFSVFKSLGFSIDLFAMQSEVGLYQRMRPDQYKMREMIFAEPRAADSPLDDRLLLDELERSVASRPRGRHITILHLKGSHYLYTQRYPREFARWQPECPGVDSLCSREELLNAYDNSMLFTDHVLARMATLLASRKALLVYTSDHGESIDDNTHFHATPKRIAPPEQLRVPLMFWASPALMGDAAFAARFSALKARTQGDVHGRTGHHNLFASLLGCLGIASPDGGVNPQHDLCRKL
jgi:KDO II ethanolaminephosphotransferase